MERAVADDPRLALGRSIAKHTCGWCRQIAWSVFGHARQVIVECEDACIAIVARATSTNNCRTQVAVGHIGGLHRGTIADDARTSPGATLPMGRNDDPLLAQRMPALFPGAGGRPLTLDLQPRIGRMRRTSSGF